MMTITNTAAPEAHVSFASHYAGEQGTLAKVATANKEPGRERFRAFRFSETTLAWDGGKQRLKLKTAPTVLLDPATVKAVVKDWDVELNIGNTADLPKYLVRRFLALWHKAQTDALNDQEAESWEKIVGVVDMRDFAVQHALPQYVEGQLVAVKDLLRVKWQDGEFSYIPRHLAPAFDLINEGEYFGAFVKFGFHGDLIEIHRVQPVTAPAEVAAIAN